MVIQDGCYGLVNVCLQKTQRYDLVVASAGLLGTYKLFPVNVAFFSYLSTCEMEILYLYLSHIFMSYYTTLQNKNVFTKHISYKI